MCAYAHCSITGMISHLYIVVREAAVICGFLVLFSTPTLEAQTEIQYEYRYENGAEFTITRRSRFLPGFPDRDAVDPGVLPPRTVLAMGSV